jgi:hypothetical protein
VLPELMQTGPKKKKKKNTYVSLTYELKKIGKVFTKVFTGPSSYKKEFTRPWSHKGSEKLF